MIELYTWKTSNGRKASIMLEEIGLPYNVHPINIGQDDQFTPEFVKINPNSKIPAIVDPDGPGGKPYTLFESGAILKIGRAQSELQSLMRISYAVFCLKKKNKPQLKNSD